MLLIPDLGYTPQMIINMTKSKSGDDGNNKGGRPPKKTPSGFPARLRAARIAQGLDVNACAKALKIIGDKWRSWERGERIPDAIEIVKIAELLNVDPFQLMLNRPRRQD